MRQLFNKYQADKTLQSWELHREAQWRYGKEVRKTSTDAWRKFCNSVNNLPLSARLNRALSRDPKIKMAFLVAPLGRCTQSEGKTLEILLVTHFPNSVVIDKVAAPATACCAKCLDWQVAARVVTYRRVKWVIDSFTSISLTPFLLKTMKQLVGRFLRNEILAFMPLHPNQHAYQAGKSVETTLHQLMVWVEKALDQQKTALGDF